MTIRLIAEAAGEPRLPSWLAEKIMEGQSPITAARHHAGLTQVETAARAGIAQSYYSAIENGVKRGSRTAIGKIAAALEVHPAWLHDADDEPARTRPERA